MMSLDYDTLDAAPASLVEASQLAKYKLSPLYCPADFVVPVNHPGNANWLYTFDLSATTNTVDLKTYNLGNFFLSLDGVPQDGKDYGYLAVEYDIELLDKNPVIEVFASKTWDSSAPALKKARSNVDPADTMTVDIGVRREFTEDPGEDRYTAVDHITLKADAAAGSLVRCVFSIAGSDAYWDSPSVSVGTILSSDGRDTHFQEEPADPPCLGVFSVEGTVGEDGIFFALTRRSNYYWMNPDVQPKVDIIAAAYTYA